MSTPPSSVSSGSPFASVMLAIHEKKTASVDLYRPLRNYIASQFSEREAQTAEDDLQSVRQMRLELERPAESFPLDARRDLLISYFRALRAIEPRFPISPDRHHVNSLSFTWHDTFRSNRKASQSNIHLEKAAVLFNLGAVYSQIGLSMERNSVDGIKLACNSFQLAAGAFAYLRDNESVKATIGGAATVDVSAECAGMLERLMLAQAQECFFEKAIGDNKAPSLCSKIARQVALFYEEAHTALSAPPLSQHFEKAWVCHVHLKATQYYAEACYRIALDLHQKEEIAVEIARLNAGISALIDAKKSSRGVAAHLLDAVNKLENNMNRNRDRAVKENERVYLLHVPDPNSLPSLQGVSLVKPTPMGEIFDATKERLFAGLVPDSSAKALSRYTEMVDDIIRTQAEKLQQGSEMTRVRLKEMDLPDSIHALEGSFSLPTELKEDVEAVQIVGGPSGLEVELQQLRDLRKVNQEMLVETEELLQKEETEDAQFRIQFGTRWTRPQSSTLTKNLQDRLNRFAGNLKQAADSDARIERAVKDNATLMSILDHHPIESALPSLARPIMSLDSNEDAIIGSLKQSLRQLEGLGAQRAGLEDMLKEMKRKDDILPKLMTTMGSQEDLFRKEISKYDPICKEIAQNIEAQEQLLIQIQTQNEHFAAVFNVENYKVAREKSYRQISAAIAKFREIKENINEGLKFYITLQDAITKIKQQSSDFVMTRNMQCREMIEDVQRQVSSLSLDSKPSYNYPSARPTNSQGRIPQQPGPQNPQYPSQSLLPYNKPPEQQMPSYTPYQPPFEQPRPSYTPPQPPLEQQRPSYTPHQPPLEQPRPSYTPHQLPHEQQRAAYNPSYGAYAPQQQSVYQAMPSAASYQPPQQPASQGYGQPAYPGWHGSYQNTPQPQQHQGSFPPSPYSAQGSYPAHQGGYYGPPR